MGIAGKFGKCCCQVETPTAAYLTKGVRWPWPGFLAWEADPATEIISIKYLRKVTRIELDSVDWNRGLGVDGGIVCIFAGTPPTYCPMPAFSAYMETEEWYVPRFCLMDGAAQTTVREGWVTGWRAYENWPDDDLAYSSTLNECGVREVFDVEDLFQSSDDAIWPDCDTICGGGEPSWALNWYQAAIYGWEAWIGDLVGTSYSGEGLIKTTTYTNGRVVETLSEPYTLGGAYGDAAALLADRNWYDVPLTYLRDDLSEFVWGTDFGAGQNGTLPVEPGVVCDGGVVVQEFRIGPLVNGMPVSHFHDGDYVYISATWVSEDEWCLTFYEYVPTAGVGALVYAGEDTLDVVGPEEVLWELTGKDYGTGSLSAGACP